MCSAGSRILVEKSIHARFVEAIVEKAKSIRLGDPFDRATKMGPLVTAAHRERVLGYVERGRLTLGRDRRAAAVGREALGQP